MFDSLNNLEKLEFLVGDSPESLKAMLKSITLPVRLLSIYAVGTKHIAWIMTDARIKKVKKEDVKNG